MKTYNTLTIRDVSKVGVDRLNCVVLELLLELLWSQDIDVG